MPIRKRKNSALWFCDYTDASGKRVRRTTGTEDKAKATALCAKWQAEAWEQKHWDKPGPVTFEQLLNDFLIYSEHNKKSYKSDLSRTRQLKPFFQGRDMRTLSAVDIYAYQQHRQAAGLKNAGINRELMLLSAAISHANKTKELNLKNPIHGRMLKEDGSRVRWITEEEAQRLIEHARHVEKAGRYLPEFIIIALHTGMRYSEIIQLTWDRVDLTNNLIYLEPKHSKNNKRASVPLNTKARASFLRLANWKAEHHPAARRVFIKDDGQPLNYLVKAFYSACKKAGIEDFHPHDLRHTCASWLVMKGESLYVVKALLRHSSIQVTERYAHLAPDNIRAAVTALETATK